MYQFNIFVYFIILGICYRTGNDILFFACLAAGVLIILAFKFYQKKRKENIKKQIENFPDKPLLNINKAAWWELEELPGVLRVQAKKIVWNRKHNGLYISKEDFFEKNNIKDKQTIDKLIFI